MKYTVSAELAVNANDTLSALKSDKNLSFFYYDRILDAFVQDTSRETLEKLQKENECSNCYRFVTKVISKPIEKSEAFDLFNILESNANIVTYPRIIPSP